MEQTTVSEIKLSDTEYLNIHPEIEKSILDGMKEPLSECVPEENIIW